MSCSAPDPRISGCVSAIVAEQATQYTRPMDMPKWALGFSRRWFALMVQRHVAHALVGPHRVVVASVALHDVVHMPQAETEKVIPALAFQVGDPEFGETVGDG